MRANAARCARRDWQRALRGLSRSAYPRAGRRVRAPHARRPAGGLGDEPRRGADRDGRRRARETIATRKASQNALEALAPLLPELLGGSADLTGSNLTNLAGLRAGRGATSRGNHINYGVREFGMAAIMNGIALHGGFIPYGGTFLTFSDYAAMPCAWRR